ncbi:MAG: cation diffusion facilitator family transporter [Gammaproteobacteria bacterium]|nr:cation diffusion facilitator family transporter [Gammaproteobacteria bacterium]
MAESSGSLKTILFALGANVSIAIVKAGAAYVTGSGAMFAEAIHSFADSGNQGLLLLGMKKARKPPSMEFPLGHGKELYFWSFVVALILFSLGGLVSFYEGLHKLQHPEPLNLPEVAIGVLIFSVFAEGTAMSTCLRQVNKLRGGNSLWHWFRNTRRSELLVIFGEDLAALLGLTIALVAVTATLITGDPVYDALGTCAIGMLLVVVAFLIGREVKDLLVGQGVEAPVRQEMVHFLEQQEEVTRVFNMVTLQMGADVMVAVKAELASAAAPTVASTMINAVEKRFREQYPQVAWLFFEPDVED